MSIARLMLMGVTPFVDLTAPQSFTIANASTTPAASKSGVVTGNTTMYGFDPSGVYLFWADGPTNNIKRNVASTPFDITTLSTTPDQTLAGGGASGTLTAVDISRDGTKIFTCNIETSNHVYSATLSTPWDLTTASSWVGSGAVLTGRRNLYLRFSFDGTKLFTGGVFGSSGVREYTLSTAWDASTASYVGQYAGGTTVNALFLSGDGTDLLFTAASTLRPLKQLELPTPFSLTAASQTTDLAISSRHGCYVTPDASKLITYSQATQLLSEFTL